jgi:hypothetical protein
MEDVEIVGRVAGMGGGGGMLFKVWRLEEDCELLMGGVAPPYDEFKVEEDLVVGMLGADPFPLLESVPLLFCVLKLDLLRCLRSRRKAGIGAGTNANGNANFSSV